MTAPAPSPVVAAAIEAANAAADVIRKAFRGDFAVRTKADASPVTEVDEAAERTIKAVLKKHFPTHAYYGEEYGLEGDADGSLWLIDPIDGTKAFVRGYPLFSVQIALMQAGEIVAGVSCAPCWRAEGGVQELVWAERGRGAWMGDTRLQVSDVAEFGRATLSTGNLARLARSPAWPRLGELIPQLHRIRGYGDFLHYHWLAGGRLDAVVESDVNILDIAALSIIVREAGGVFTDLEGQPLGLKTTSVLAATPGLHDALLRQFDYTPPV